MISQGKKKQSINNKNTKCSYNICQLLKKIFFDYNLNLGLM